MISLQVSSPTPASKKSPDNVADYNQGRNAIYDKHVKNRSDNLGVVIPRPEATSETRANDNSTSAKIGRTLRNNIPSPATAARKISGKIGSAVDTIRTGKSRTVAES